METIIDWFTELKDQYPNQTDIIDKIIAGIDINGFNGELFDNWLKEKLEIVEANYKSELKEDSNAEN